MCFECADLLIPYRRHECAPRKVGEQLRGEITEGYLEGLSQYELAKKHGLSKTTIGRVLDAIERL